MTPTCHQLVAPDQLRDLSLELWLDGRVGRGVYLYRFRSQRFPRLVKEVRRNGLKHREKVTFFVDGRRVGKRLPIIAAALNRAHDLIGLPARLEGCLFHCTAEFINGRLVVRGASAERCELQRRLLPSFEGVPIEWVLPVLDAPASAAGDMELAAA